MVTEKNLTLRNFHCQQEIAVEKALASNLQNMMLFVEDEYFRDFSVSAPISNIQNDI